MKPLQQEYWQLFNNHAAFTCLPHSPWERLDSLLVALADALVVQALLRLGQEHGLQRLQNLGGEVIPEGKPNTFIHVNVQFFVHWFLLLSFIFDDCISRFTYFEKKKKENEQRKKTQKHRKWIHTHTHTRWMAQRSEWWTQGSPQRAGFGRPSPEERAGQLSPTTLEWWNSFMCTLKDFQSCSPIIGWTLLTTTIKIMTKKHIQSAKEMNTTNKQTNKAVTRHTIFDFIGVVWGDQGMKCSHVEEHRSLFSGNITAWGAFPTERISPGKLCVRHRENGKEELVKMRKTEWMCTKSRFSVAVFPCLALCFHQADELTHSLTHSLFQRLPCECQIPAFAVFEKALLNARERPEVVQHQLAVFICFFFFNPKKRKYLACFVLFCFVLFAWYLVQVVSGNNE